MDMDEVVDWKTKLVEGSNGNFVDNGGDYPILYWQLK